MSAPIAIPMSSVVSVASLAAASSSVSCGGSRYGSCASTQPTVIAVTAAADDSRAGP
jgi:hypothetical protein